MNRLNDWKTWIHGLGAAAIGGGASAGSAWGGMVVGQKMGIDLPDLNFKALGVICLSSGLFAALAYLKQSPLPDLETPTTPQQPPKP